MQRTKWVDRKFIFELPEGWLFNVVERLKGTEARLMTLVKDLSNEQCEQKPGGKWSIKEHIGHLTDLEELHDGRIDDFLARKETLRAADMSNVKTNMAKHNERSIAALLENFAEKRNAFAVRLLTLDDPTLQFSSIHPRLQVPMRPVDMAYFTAEHDDHHLASIREVLGQIEM